MPKYRVTKGHDAYIYFSAIVEAASADDAHDLAKSGEVDWGTGSPSEPFDDYELFKDLTEEIHEDELKDALAEHELEQSRCRQTFAGPDLHRALTAAWDFIENVSPDEPTRTDQFFALREIVRSAFKACEPSP